MRTQVSAAVAILVALVPLSAFASSTPLAGRWDGVFHGGRGDQPVTFVCRPGIGGSLGGLLYMGGDLMGPLEEGRIDGDSLRFRVMNFELRAHRSGDQMTVSLFVPNGRTHEFDLRFASGDTSAVAQSPEAAAAARARTAPDWKLLPDSVLAAHDLGAGVAVGPSPALDTGTLLLVGGGPAQGDLDAEFARLAGGASARVVVIPTAGIGPGTSDDPLLSADRWSRVLGVSHVTVLHTTSRAEADQEAFVRPLEEANAVWIAGGEAGRILVSYLGTRTERELMKLLARGGVIGGTSAGALVWGSRSLVFRQPKDGSPYVMGNADDLLPDDPHSVGFGALRNVVVSPHFTEFHMQASMEKEIAAHPGTLGLGVDEATALEVHGDVVRVLGRGHALIYDGRKAAGAPTILDSGARYDLVRRSVL